MYKEKPVMKRKKQRMRGTDIPRCGSGCEPGRVNNDTNRGVKPEVLTAYFT